MKTTITAKRAAWGILRLITAMSMALSWVATIPATPAAAASLTLTPLTWNVIGLDSNDETVGPNIFPVGVRACASGGAVTNVQADFVWDSANANINLRPGTLDPTPVPGTTIASGACKDFYFEVEITRADAVRLTSRAYHTTVTGNDPALISVSTPLDREIFVDNLNSQNRNSVNSILLDGVPIAPGGTLNMLLGGTYDIQVIADTAPQGYAEIETFINIPNWIFRINSVTTTYGADPPPGHVDPVAGTKMYADGCLWNNAVGSAGYRDCTLNGNAIGNYGAQVTVTYKVTVIGGVPGADQTLNTLIYDGSGSSFHYNNDFDSESRIVHIIGPDLTVDKTNNASDSVVFPNTFSWTLTVSNTGGTATFNNGAVILTDTLPSGATYPLGAVPVLHGGTPPGGTGTISCSIAGGVLTCTAIGGAGTTVTLAAGASFSVTFLVTPTAAGSLANPTGGVNNCKVDPSGLIAESNETNNTCANTVTVTRPALSIVKTATPPTYSAAGAIISYSYKLTNSGNVTLSGPFTVSDDKAADESCPATASLAPGAFITCTASYTITQTDLDNGLVTNVASAHGFYGTTPVTSPTDTETVTAVARPALSIMKTATPGTYSAVGNLISYSYKVTNSGNVTLAGPVTVTDDKATVTCPAGGLAPGAFMTCTASYTITQTDLDSGSVKNTAQAHSNGTDSNQDDETVGKVSITKTIIPPDDQGFTTSPDVAIGEIVRFRVAAQVPAGSFPNASIVDALGPGLAFVSCVGITPSGLSSACSSPTVEAGGLTVTFPLGNLLYAESGTITIDYEAVVLDIVDNKNGVDRFNTVNFVWGVENDRSTIGPAHETVHILEPSLFITKAADTPFVEEGLEFYYTLAVQHTTGTSTTDAYDVEVDDTLPAGLQLASPLDLDCGVSPGKPADACTGVAGGNVIHAEYASLLFGPPAEQAIIRFKVKAVGLPPGEILNSASAEWTSLPQLAGVLRSTYNDSSTERGFAGDPSDPLNPNRYFASSSTPVTPLGGGGGCTGGNCGKPGIGGFLIPVTGFTPGVVTALGPQSAVYDDNMGLTLEIPKMKLKMSIVGVPLVGGNWKVDWLSGVGGWLQGTAFPGLSGNSVITSHVVSHYGTDGPFAHLNTLGVGDKIFITAFNRQYIYEVKSVGNVAPNDISVFKHELKPVLTLITCSKYNAATQTYDARLVVKTALLEVRALK